MCPLFWGSLLVTAGGMKLSHVHVHVFLPESRLVLPDGVALIPGAPNSCRGWVSPRRVGRRRWVGDKIPEVETTVERNRNEFFNYQQRVGKWLLSLIPPSLHLSVERPAHFCEFCIFIGKASAALDLRVTRKLN